MVSEQYAAQVDIIQHALAGKIGHVRSHVCAVYEEWRCFYVPQSPPLRQALETVLKQQQSDRASVCNK